MNDLKTQKTLYFDEISAVTKKLQDLKKYKEKAISHGISLNTYTYKLMRIETELVQMMKEIEQRCKDYEQSCKELL